MTKSVYRRISIELDDRLKALQEELLRNGVPMTKISVSRVVAQKIPEINIKINLFKAKRRKDRVQIE